MQKICLALLLMAAGSAAPAADGIAVTGAWARATAPGQKTGAVYLELKSTQDAALVGAESPAARKIELHSTTLDSGVMRMRPLARIELPANATVRIAPGGFHLMLVDLRQPLHPGDRLQVTLIIERGGARSRVAVTAEVRAPGDTGHGAHVH
jgi:copper(I)-binding protein